MQIIGDTNDVNYKLSISMDMKTSYVTITLKIIWFKMRIQK